MIHVNDSKTALGSRVDRHDTSVKENRARGIQPNPESSVLAGKAFILETSIDKPGDDMRNVAALWKLLGRSVVAERTDSPV